MYIYLIERKKKRRQRKKERETKEREDTFIYLLFNIKLIQNGKINYFIYIVDVSQLKNKTFENLFCKLFAVII